VCGVLLRWAHTPGMTSDWPRKSESATRAAERAVKGAFPGRVASVFSYGAVDIDPKYLMVWVMLEGPEDRLPKWFLPSPLREVAEPDSFGLLDDLYAMQRLVREAFERVEWPQWEHVDVGFESEERVRNSGGWNYFR